MATCLRSARRKLAEEERSPDAAQRHQRVHARLRRAMLSRRGALLIWGP
jgi:hypothetical protein